MDTAKTEKKFMRTTRPKSIEASKPRDGRTVGNTGEIRRLGDLKMSEGKKEPLRDATKREKTRIKNPRPRLNAIGKPPATATPPRACSAPPREHSNSVNKAAEHRRGSTVTSRIREREAVFAKRVEEREEEITRLKNRLKVLSKKLSDSSKDKCSVVGDPMEDERKELSNIIRQVSKERLQLERHLQIANESLLHRGQDIGKYLSLEQTNSHLRQQLDSLDLLQQEHKLVEIQYREKEEACRELMNSLKYKSALCQDLETQLAKVIEKNTELTVANSDLKKKVLRLEDVNEECRSLQFNLNKMEKECVSAKSEVASLSGKVRSLESVLEEMHRTAENRREIERQHKEALDNLKRKQDEVGTTACKKQANFVEQLRRRIEDLEDEKRMQNERHQRLILEMAEINKYKKNAINHGSDDLPPPSDNLEIDAIIAKLEQDNKFLADLERQRAAVTKLDTTLKTNNCSTSTLHRSTSAVTDSGFLSQSSLNCSPTATNASVQAASSVSSVRTWSPKQLDSREVADNNPQTLNRLPGLSGADKINLLNGIDHLDDKKEVSKMSTDFISKDGMIEMPGKGRCFVYVARYSYDPFQHSPNDSPEAELQANAGDYILVWGNVDEDGFFDGELLDGRRGLVPSNFVQKLHDRDLLDFHKQVVLGLGDCDDSVCTSIPQDLEIMDEERKTQNHQLSIFSSCTDLDTTEDDEAIDTAPLPPKQLTLEIQQNKSLLVGWSPPEDGYRGSYQVWVDGVMRETTTAAATFSATITGLDLAAIHRVSVRSVWKDLVSHEAACTMFIGKDAPQRPTAVRAIRITPTAATLQWMPSNTNFMHAIFVNGVEVKTVRPGVFRHTLVGLQPQTSYRVVVSTKNIKASAVSQRIDQNFSTYVEIRTKPPGLPDPPLDVRVETVHHGLLVSWLPVTINPSGGTSNGAPVTGYIVYGDGEHQLADVESGTADQVQIDLKKPPKFITVKTKSSNGILSNESERCPLFLAEDKTTLEDQQVTSLRPPRELKNDDSDIGPSELSDIAEEPEDGLTTDSEENRTSTAMSPEVSSVVRPRNQNLSSSAFLNFEEKPTTKPTTTTTTTTSTTTFSSSQFQPLYSTVEESSRRIIRIFVALFDYDPPTMSPNPDSCDEELPFKEGQLIRVYGDKDSDGFYWGETGGVAGYVPCNMVSEVQVEDDRVVDEILTGRFKTETSSRKVRRKLALYDYDPTELSPNVDSEVELSFRTGDILLVYGDMDEDGFYMGELRGRRGLVPSNFLSQIPSSC